ncbi:L-arabinose isomerase [Sulfobacillus acidophilus TPY]|uniref:L-arabinose isomerase n=1 Tax=Sulfobacillus acidophilus (strain ATCC 700253 / DSM 10332 / NAL) TaxID=679936 RepID=G8TSY2_SULAD|nr:L-arabinose isomerase [Sulfobacillus acidophilus TPY]AEW05597.1 L-arabinose isomerase [Sulfobacillus acidophilus DSM 10332]
MSFPDYEFWFIAGSQHLYGPEVLRQINRHIDDMVRDLNQDQAFPYPVIARPVVSTPDGIRQVLREANDDDRCAGVIVWMHTFSPAQMWIAGLRALQKPLLHLHTQMNRDIPWDTIDMDYMNLHQSAHGDREFGHLTARLKTPRKVLVGHWQDQELRRDMARWMDTAAAVSDSLRLKIARFGDNMRDVAVTEGDKVAAQIRLGWSVKGFGVGDLAERVNRVADERVDRLLDFYQSTYEVADNVRHDANRWNAVAYQARLELALRDFLADGGFHAVTTTFEDLHGLRQLPGLAVQRLMADGYGFGAEGDWKTAALLRVVKRMARFQGTSFMEDYTYHLEPGQEAILGAHMLEVCPSIADGTPRIEVWPLSIGSKEDPARLVFDARPGEAVVASLVDLGSRFRLVVNEVTAVAPPPMPRLPVARALWRPHPSLKESAAAWIYAGGAHHTVFSYGVTSQQLKDWADALGIECVVINRESSAASIRQMLEWNEAVYR